MPCCVTTTAAWAGSTGDFATATPQDLASDAAAALAYVKSHPRVLSEKTGYIGHSEGGYLAPIAQQIEPAAFHVYLAGPACRLFPMSCALRFRISGVRKPVR